MLYGLTFEKSLRMFSTGNKRMTNLGSKNVQTANLNKYLQWLGTNVEDRVTGFKGMVSTIGFDAYGCVQAVVTPRVNDKGEAEPRWYDIKRLNCLSRTMEVPIFAELGTEAGPAEKPR